MNMNHRGSGERAVPQRLFLWSLIIAVFATAVIDVIIPLFLVDIAKSFGVSQGIASQIRTFSAIAQIFPALLIGLLVVRFRPKFLLIAGVLCISLAAIGSFLATSLGLMQVFYAFNGVGSVIVMAMALTVIGEEYPLDKKPQAIGAITATNALGFVISAPLSALISDFGGWRSTFSLLVLPISIAATLLVLYFIPSRSQNTFPTLGQEPHWDKFKAIIRIRSAAACLIYQIFFLSVFAIGTFGIAFFKGAFGISTADGSWIIVGGGLSGAAGSLIGGRLTNKIGRKALAVAASILSSVFAMVAFYMPFLWLILALRYTSLVLWGIAVSSGASLMLEQVPKFRGSMMSLRVAFASVGSALGVAIGGTVLGAYDYQTVALVLGALGIVGSMILLFGAKDPVKPMS